MKRPLTHSVFVALYYSGYLFVTHDAIAAPADVTHAEQSAADFSSIAGSTDAIENNLTQGITSGTSIHTPAGSSFNANIGCLSDDNFMELFIAPGSGGDIATLRIQQDTTQDGHYDRLFEPPFIVSGVCANGVISCDTGSWNNCVNYKWAVDTANNAIGLAPAGITELGNCYCINNTCGNTLVSSNLESIVSDLAGGATAALAAINPYYIISKAHITGPVGRFSGQHVQNCASTTLPTIDAATLFNSPTEIENRSQAQTGTDPLYQLVAGSPAASNSNQLSTEHHCAIDRSIAVNAINPSDVILQTGGTGSVTLCGSSCIRLTLGRVGDNYWHAGCGSFREFVRFTVLRPDLITDARLVYSKWDDWIQVYLNDSYIWSGPWNNFFNRTGGPPGPCELSTNWQRGLNVPFTSAIKNNTDVHFDMRTIVAGAGEGFLYANVLLNTSCLPGADIINNTCAALATDPQCTLFNETVDGVATINDGAVTGLSPLPSSRSFSDGVCSVTQERPFWQKQRTYRCLGDLPEFDFNQALERNQHVKESTTTTSYEDRILDNDDNPIISTGGLAIIDEVNVPTCPEACKVRELVVSNSVTVYGTETQDVNTDNTEYQFRYHACEQGVCPIVGAEEIVKDCGCLNEFAESSVILQTFRTAGKDQTCSSGVAQ